MEGAYDIEITYEDNEVQIICGSIKTTYLKYDNKNRLIEEKTIFSDGELDEQLISYKYLEDKISSIVFIEKNSSGNSNSKKYLFEY